MRISQKKTNIINLDFSASSSINENIKNTSPIEERKMDKLKEKQEKQVNIVDELKDISSHFKLSDYTIDENKIEVKKIPKNFLPLLESFLTTAKKLTSLQHLTLDFW